MNYKRHIQASWIILPLFILGIGIIAFHHHHDGEVHEDCPICLAVAHTNAVVSFITFAPPLQVHYSETLPGYTSFQVSLIITPANPRAPPLTTA
ncbi:MAG: hypothetical protein P9X24_06890 [Candidatus Hatepunaea meridiana]|nr:hypothetical protein [Candidatus Hatepunaea meridiana]